MNYYIDIIDTTTGEHILIQEKASRNNVNLQWHGSDQKDELRVVGSSVSFDMLVMDYSDAYFIDLFTANETRFRVEVKADDDDRVLWVGHLLAETYSEPYTNNNLFVNFTATCGMGRLKGKFLPDDFYRDEKSVVAIISKCLELTGLKLNLFFSPAIENISKKPYHEMYLPTGEFIDGEKKMDAYAVLDRLMKNMICCVYQSDGQFICEGLNKRHLLNVIYQKYLFDGTFVEDFQYPRLQKQVNKPLGTPQITIVPPYGRIIVGQERRPQELPETVSKEKNDGWAVSTGVSVEIYATDWQGRNGFFAKAKFSQEYKVKLNAKWGTSISAIDQTKYVDLKKRIYISKGQIMQFEFEVSNTRSPLIAASTNAFVKNGMRVEIYNGSDLINTFIASFGYENLDDPFNEQEEYFSEINYTNFKVKFDVIAQNSGLLNIRIYEPFCDNVAVELPLTPEWYLEKLEMKRVDFVDESVLVDTINDEFTITKEIDLDITDDASGFSSAFRMEPLDAIGTEFSVIQVPILHSFEFQGSYYSQVALDGANLISDNIGTVKHSGSYVQDLEVVYNFNTGEQMLVKTPSLISSGNFDVEVYANAQYDGERESWEKWTDSIYQIEEERYDQIVANVYRRMFSVVHEKIDLEIKDSIKFNDILQFRYIDQRKYLITNCRYNFDSGKSIITMVRNFYQGEQAVSGNPGSNDGNIPPIVDAGPDITIGENATSATLSSTSYDPDGFVSSLLWEKISGIDGLINTPGGAGTVVSYLPLNGDVWEYKITATDNEGATGVDFVKVFRSRNYTAFGTIICMANESFQGGGGGGFKRYKTFKLNVNIPANIAAKVTVYYENMPIKTVDLYNDPDGSVDGCAQYGRGIQKNGILIWEPGTSPTETIEINMISGDDLRFTMFAYNNTTKNQTFTIQKIDFVGNPGVVVGLPLTYHAFGTFTV